jgi:quercetin dioxygenase-like cupin family protein
MLVCVPGCLCYFRFVVNAGDVIENPVTGERITFVRTSEQTGGALAELDLELSPTAFLAAEHIHRSQEEKFQVLEGHVLVRCRGQESMSGPGETVSVPPGAPHAWAPHNGAARVRITFTPGAGIENFFDEFFRLARQGRVNSKGMPSLPVTARLGLAHDMYLAGPPVPLQRAAFRVLATTEKLLHRSSS